MASKKRNVTSTSNRRYEEFIRNLEPVAMGLAASTCKLDRTTYVRLSQTKKGASRNITATYTLKAAAPEYFDTEAALKLTVKDRKTGARPLVIECVFEAHFHGKKPIDKDLANRFTNSELRLVIWPYFRQFVSDITARMHIRPITLPLSAESPADLPKA